MYCLIVPFKNSFDELGITYFIPDFLISELKVGQIVEIPFRENIELGVVLQIGNIDNSHFDSEKIKSIITIKNHEVFLENYQIELIFWMAKYYFSQIHHVLNLFFPKNLKEKIEKEKLDLKKTKKYHYNFDYDIHLNDSQKKSLNQIQNSNNNKFLLYGLTGSGKTELYIQLIQESLKQGKQSLFLIPEIILNNQLSDRLKKVFGDEVIVINSSVAAAQKTKYWIDIYNDNAKIIIGTRSALFYPFQSLDTIIIDEEQDNSYISDSIPRYNAIEIANELSTKMDAKLILGSGTPSVKNMYNALKGEYDLVSLLEKYGD